MNRKAYRTDLTNEQWKLLKPKNFILSVFKISPRLLVVINQVVNTAMLTSFYVAGTISVYEFMCVALKNNNAVSHKTFSTLNGFPTGIWLARYFLDARFFIVRGLCV